MRPSSLGLIFQLQQFAASPPSQRYFPPPPQDCRSRYLNHPCLYCKRQTHPTMEEYEMCCKYDSFREVSGLIIKAYTLAFLLLAMVVLWTAGDACLCFGLSYLDYRYDRLNNLTGYAGFE